MIKTLILYGEKNLSSLVNHGVTGAVLAATFLSALWLIIGGFKMMIMLLLPLPIW